MQYIYKRNAVINQVFLMVFGICEPIACVMELNYNRNKDAHALVLEEAFGKVSSFCIIYMCTCSYYYPVV